MPCAAKRRCSCHAREPRGDPTFRSVARERAATRQVHAMNKETRATAPGRAPKQIQVRPRPFRGPVPISWLSVAAKLPGKSLHAGLAIWYAAEHWRSDQVALSNIDACEFGLNRNAKYRALQWLEMAGLISVKRMPGQPPLVSVVRDGAAS